MTRGTLLLATGVAGIVIVGFAFEPRLWIGQQQDIAIWRVAALAAALASYGAGWLLLDRPPLADLHD